MGYHQPLQSMTMGMGMGIGMSLGDQSNLMPGPPQMTHSNSAPEIPYYEQPSVFAPPDQPLHSNTYPGMPLNHHQQSGYATSSVGPNAGGPMPMASYIPDYHFGGPPMTSPMVYAAPAPNFPNGPLGPPEGEWDDDDAREADMVYGNLEVSSGEESILASPASYGSVPSPKPQNAPDLQGGAKKRQKGTGPGSVRSSGPSSLAESITAEELLALLDEAEENAFGTSFPVPPSLDTPAVREPIPSLFDFAFWLQDGTSDVRTTTYDQVKHRRRTTPEQLRLLQYWFGRNPKPDAALREWLANELGMTKRKSESFGIGSELTSRFCTSMVSGRTVVAIAARLCSTSSDNQVPEQAGVKQERTASTSQRIRKRPLWTTSRYIGHEPRNHTRAERPQPTPTSCHGRPSSLDRRRRSSEPVCIPAETPGRH